MAKRSYERAIPPPPLVNSAQAKLEHLLDCIYAEYSSLNETGPPKLPVTREEIYLDHD